MMFRLRNFLLLLSLLAPFLAASGAAAAVDGGRRAHEHQAHSHHAHSHDVALASCPTCDAASNVSSDDAAPTPHRHGADGCCHDSAHCGFPGIQLRASATTGIAPEQSSRRWRILHSVATSLTEKDVLTPPPRL